MNRGIINNNPFNIRRNAKNKWLGRIPLEQSTDNEFEQFKLMRYGLRAGIVLLRNYLRFGFNTPYKIIRKFAPPLENDTLSYLRFINNHGLGDGDYIIFGSDKFYKLARLICRYESDFDISVSDLQEISFQYKIKA